MGNVKIYEMFSTSIIKNGFKKYLSDDYKKVLSSDDVKEIHFYVYDYYSKKDFNNVKQNEIDLENLNQLMDYFIEIEEYEKCGKIKTYINYFNKNFAK